MIRLRCRAHAHHHVWKECTLPGYPQVLHNFKMLQSLCFDISANWPTYRHKQMRVNNFWRDNHVSEKIIEDVK